MRMRDNVRVYTVWCVVVGTHYALSFCLFRLAFFVTPHKYVSLSYVVVAAECTWMCSLCTRMRSLFTFFSHSVNCSLSLPFLPIHSIMRNGTLGSLGHVQYKVQTNGISTCANLHNTRPVVSFPDCIWPASYCSLEMRLAHLSRPCVTWQHIADVRRYTMQSAVTWAMNNSYIGTAASAKLALILPTSSAVSDDYHVFKSHL